MQARQLWGWSDANPKLTPSQRLGGAIRAYQAKFDTLPTCCLVHPGTLAQLEGQLGCSVYGTPGMPRSAFYFTLPGNVL